MSVDVIFPLIFFINEWAYLIYTLKWIAHFKSTIFIGCKIARVKKLKVEYVFDLYKIWEYCF